MKRTDPEPNCIETAGGFRVKIPNPFPCTLCGEEKGGVRLWASKSKNGHCRAQWICYPCWTERIVEEYGGIHEPHRKAARKKFRQGLDIVQAGR